MRMRGGGGVRMATTFTFISRPVRSVSGEVTSRVLAGLGTYE